MGIYRARRGHPCRGHSCRGHSCDGHPPYPHHRPDMETQGFVSKNDRVEKADRKADMSWAQG